MCIYIYIRKSCEIKYKCGPYCVGFSQNRKWVLYIRYGDGGLSELHVGLMRSLEVITFT